MIKLSIIMPLLNDLHGLADTILALNKIDYEFFELIVIDGSESAIEKCYFDQFNFKINYINIKGIGLYAAMNAGLSLSNGHYCYFIGAGDKMLRIPELTGEDIIVCRVNVDGKLLKVRENYYYLYFMNSLHHQASFYKNKNLFFDENLKILSDYKLNIILRIVNNARVKFLPDLLVCDVKKHVVSSNLIGSIFEAFSIFKELNLLFYFPFYLIIILLSFLKKLLLKPFKLVLPL